MVRRLVVANLFLILGLSSNAFAVGNTADVTLGNYQLLPNTPNQTIPIYVTGGALVAGMNFNLQVGDGGPAHGGTPGPVFTNVDLVSNTIFQNDHAPPTNLGSQPDPQVLTWDIVTANNGDYVSANGLLATVTVDTTGFTNGETFPLEINNTLNGRTNFVYDGVTPVPSTLVDGQITVLPEPSTFFLLATVGVLLCGQAIWRKSRASHAG